MKEKDSSEFSWPLLFLVTSASFFIFSGLLKFINAEHTSFFFYVGFTSLALAGISSIKKMWTAEH